MGKFFGWFLVFVLLSIFSSAFVSCNRNADLSSVKREDKFSLSYGHFEDQLQLFNVDIAMRDGFFYISDGELQKIVKMNSFGDLLTLCHNPETNPAPLFDETASKLDSVASTRKTIDYPFSMPTNLALDTRQYTYVVEMLPKERFETADNKILRQVVLRFDSNSFVDYIGQQGIGGTPFPFIRDIYTNSDDSLVVVCVLIEGFEIFHFNSKGALLHDTIIKYSDAPSYIEERPGITRFAEIENVVPDPSSHRLFVKADYYEVSMDSGKGQSGIGEPLTVVFPYDLRTNTFGKGIEIQPYEESVTKGFAKQTYKLSYDLIGATPNGWLFFMISVDSGCVVQMVRTDGSRVERRLLKFDAKNTVYSTFSLSESGIISALLAERESAKIVWWRTDVIARSIIEAD